MKKISFLLPTLNEQESIGRTIDEIPVKELSMAGYDLEIIVVDGGSSDATVAVAEARGAIIVPSERGYGRQFKVGFTKAGGDFIITADSDGSYPLSGSLSLISLFEREGLDFITTNRFAGIEDGAMHPLNRIGNVVLTMLVNLLFDLRLKDSQSGMWVIRRAALSRMRLASDGMALSEEIKIEAFQKLRAREVASSYKKRIGKIKLKRLRDGWGNMVHLFRMKWERITQ